MNESKIKTCNAKYHAHEIELALETFYWTDDSFHYLEAISHFESLVSEMAKLQTEYKREIKK